MGDFLEPPARCLSHLRLVPLPECCPWPRRGMVRSPHCKGNSVITGRNLTGRRIIVMEMHMLSAGKALKVSIYLSEGTKHRGVSAYSAILDIYSSMESPGQRFLRESRVSGP